MTPEMSVTKEWPLVPLVRISCSLLVLLIYLVRTRGTWLQGQDEYAAGRLLS